MKHADSLGGGICVIGNGRLVFSLIWVCYWLIWWAVKRFLMYRSKREHGNCCRDLAPKL